MCYTRYIVVITLKEQKKLLEDIINNLNKSLYAKVIKYNKLKECNLVRLSYTE